MLEGLDAIDWPRQDRPPDNLPNEVPEALRQLARVVSLEQGQRAYDRVLYAVGNNHRGTYYPVVLAVIPFLEEVATAGAVPASEAALDVLIDLVTAFGPEREFTDAQGNLIELQAAVRQTVAAAEARIRSSLGASSSLRQQQLATELSEGLRRVE